MAGRATARDRPYYTPADAYISYIVGAELAPLFPLITVLAPPFCT